MQKLAEVCVKRPVFAAMLVLALVVVGATSYFRLGVDRFPSVDVPTVRVSTRLPGASPQEVEALVSQRIEEALSGLGFSPADRVRPPSSLSGGEQTRGALARLLISDPELLLLDEPTNHLDLPAIEQLEQAMDSFDGTVLLVTHDRRMLDTVRLTRRWHVDGGQVTEVVKD